MLLQARAEPAVVIDEDLGVGELMLKPAPMSALSRPNLIPVVEVRLPGTPMSVVTIVCEVSRNRGPTGAKLGNERAVTPIAMREARRAPSVVWKELPSAAFTENVPKPPVSLEAPICAFTNQGRVRREAHTPPPEAPRVAGLRMALIAWPKASGPHRWEAEGREKP